jgi:hypothetical protein
VRCVSASAFASTVLVGCGEALGQFRARCPGGLPQCLAVPQPDRRLPGPRAGADTRVDRPAVDELIPAHGALLAAGLRGGSSDGSIRSMSDKARPKSRASTCQRSMSGRGPTLTRIRHAHRRVSAGRRLMARLPTRLPTARSRLVRYSVLRVPLDRRTCDVVQLPGPGLLGLVLPRYEEFAPAPQNSGACRGQASLTAARGNARGGDDNESTDDE